MKTFPLRWRVARREAPLRAIRKLEAAFKSDDVELDLNQLELPQLMMAYLLHSRVLVNAGRPVPREFDLFVSNLFHE